MEALSILALPRKQSGAPSPRPEAPSLQFPLVFVGANGSKGSEDLGSSRQTNALT